LLLYDDGRRPILIAADNDTNDRGREFAYRNLEKLSPLRDLLTAPRIIFPLGTKDYGEASASDIHRQLEALGHKPGTLPSWIKPLALTEPVTLTDDRHPVDGGVS